MVMCPSGDHHQCVVSLSAAHDSAMMMPHRQASSSSSRTPLVPGRRSRPSMAHSGSCHRLS